ncbi:MAG: M12 family metallo-peptidase, partial [Saprospiraceae bacterium]
MVLDAKQNNEASFVQKSLFQTQKSAAAQHTEVTKAITEGTILTIDQNLTKQLLAERPTQITLDVPQLAKSALQLDLVQVDLFQGNGQQVRTSATGGNYVNIEQGVHYRGMIRGDENSVAAVSIFNNEIMALISNAAGNFILAQIENSTNGEHVFYKDSDLKQSPNFDCAVPDENYFGYSTEELAPLNANKGVGDCVGIYIEGDKDIHDAKGGVQGATNYLTALFNQSATIYANESITVGISDIFIWNSRSPYKGSDAGRFLSKFQQTQGSSWTGDLAILCNLNQSSGGIAAGFSGICNSNRGASMSYAGIASSFNNVPTYSWSVMVFTHELGHLFGSRHTHACVWNGNNTAIDGCSGVEGTCSRPGFPSNGGTIMSYCHLQSVGINFNNGFGTQPGNVIRNNVAGGNCLAAECGGDGGGGGNDPTCTDGVQNGDENPNPVSEVVNISLPNDV